MEGLLSTWPTPSSLIVGVKSASNSTVFVAKVSYVAILRFRRGN